MALPDQAPALERGEIDALAFKAIIPERRSALCFSAPLTISGAAWFCRTTGPGPDNADEPGIRLASPAAGPLLAQLRRLHPAAVFIDVATYAEALASVAAREADLAALNFHVGRYLAERDHPGAFRLPDAPFQPMPVGLAMKAGADDSAIAGIDAALEVLRAGGGLDAIERRWLG